MSKFVVQWDGLSAEDQLEAIRRLSVITDEGCWQWTRQVDSHGYGIVRRRSLHRFAYELVHGPIPAGLTIDHECHNRAAHDGRCSGGDACRHRRCANPAHLRAVTIGTNTRASPFTHSSAKTRCVRGHLLEGRNLVVTARGRACRACIRQARRKRVIRANRNRGHD